MRKLITIDKWSRLEKTLEQKPNILLSQFALIAVIACIIQIINDSIFSNFYGVLFDIFVGAVFLLAYVFNERGKHLLAKFTFVVLGTGFIFVFASIISKESGVYLLFMPIITVTFLIFGNEERKPKYLAIAYIVLLLFILEATSYHPFGDINITNSKSEPSSFYVNMAVGVFAIIFSMYNIEVISRQIDQKRLEVEKELIQKNKDLEKVNEELDRFVYSASHDLKAPLSSILGLINVAKYEIQEDSAKEYLHKIENRVKRLVQFIGDVLAISRNARTNEEKQEVMIDQFIYSLVENLKSWSDDFVIHYDLQLQVDKPLYLDKGRLEIIMNNLIVNAIKYQRPDEVHKTVRIKSKLDDQYLMIEIMDNGIGVPLDFQSKIFDMFFRGSNHNSEGSGLGLYIVKNAVDKMGGKIDFSSQLGRGSTFSLKIPV